MKPKLILLAIILTTISCTNERQTTLSQTRKDSITKEVESVLNQIIDDWRTKNINTVYNQFLNSPDFTFIAVDGSIVDYSTMIESSRSMLDSWKDVRYNLVEKKINIVNQTFVIASIIYNCEITYPDGKIEKYPKVGSTLGFGKINNKWSVLHFQESCLAPDVIQPEKK